MFNNLHLFIKSLLHKHVIDFSSFHFKLKAFVKLFSKLNVASQHKYINFQLNFCLPDKFYPTKGSTT